MTTDDPERKDEPAASDEPRAKDLLTRPREELEQAMDPATLAQLASWFDMPNLADAEEAEAVADMQSAEELEREELRKRKEAACANADPAFVKHIERHERAELAVAPVFELTSFVDESIVNVVVRAQLERQSSDDPQPDVREYFPPHDIMEITRQHNAPQAILRDLYRPETYYEKARVSPFEDVPEFDARREVREALRERIKIDWLEPTFAAGLAAKAEGKALLRRPWAEFYDEVQAIKKDREERTLF